MVPIAKILKQCQKSGLAINGKITLHRQGRTVKTPNVTRKGTASEAMFNWVKACHDWLN